MACGSLNSNTNNVKANKETKAISNVTAARSYAKFLDTGEEKYM
ncbi:MAG: hypothetical protein WBG30_07590 [Psychrilyobacter sp.]